MANMQFQNTTVFHRCNMGKVQTAQTVRISVKNEIAEVYSVGAESVVTSCEVSDGQVSLFGKTSLKFLYNDGAGIVGSTYNADFNTTISNEAIASGQQFCFDVAVVDCKTQTNANTATVSLLLEVTACAYVAQEVVYLADGEDCFVKKQSVEVLSQAGVCNIPLAVEEQLSATSPIAAVLLAESNLCIAEHSLADGVLKVGGEAVVRLTYLSEGKPVTDQLVFPFQSEAECSAPQEAQLFITPRVRSTKVRLDIAEDSVNTTFSAEISALLQVEYCVSSTISVVTDAYGSNCDFDFERTNVLTTLPCGSATANRAISSALPGEANSADALVNIAVQATCACQNNSVRVEGVLQATALVNSPAVLQQLEVPFVQSADIPCCNNCQCALAAVANKVTFANGTVNAELCFAVCTLQDISFAVITAAEEIPFDKTKLPAIEVCLAHKGDTVWSLAKGLHMSEEDLLAVNQVSDPLQKDERIVVFNKI